MVRRDGASWLAQDGEGRRSQYPEGDGPLAVDRPTISKASYLHAAVGVTHVFLVPPLARERRSVPWRVGLGAHDAGTLLHDVVEFGRPALENTGVVTGVLLAFALGVTISMLLRLPASA